MNAMPCTVVLVLAFAPEVSDAVIEAVRPGVMWSELTEVAYRAIMVFTVEPWYYNHDLGISVFVEDVVLVTEPGVEVLTRGLPRSADALAQMVPNARR